MANDFDIDLSELDALIERLVQIERDFPKEARKMMINVGNQARTIVVRYAKTMVPNSHYYKLMTRGKVWIDDNGVLRTRIYAKAKKAKSEEGKKYPSNIAHLIEYGHRIVGKDGQERGFVLGRKVFGKSREEVSKEFVSIVEKQLNKTFDKL